MARGRFLTEETERASVTIENRRVEMRCWRYSAKGVRNFEVLTFSGRGLAVN
jgi:hypothetical protein